MRRDFIENAINNAEKSTLKIANHGAIVIYRGKIVGNGYNKYCVENINKVNRWSVHAEVDAINDALRKISKENLKKSILVVVRKIKNYEINKELSSKVSQPIGLSAPCKCCTNYIKKFGIKTCFYS